MTPLPHPFRRLNQRGAAMLEMALTIPVFMGLLLALVDFGMYFTTRSVLQSAAYNGAKMACVDPYSAANVDAIVKATVGTVADTSPLSFTITKTLIGATPLRRYQVVVSCPGTKYSAFTSTLNLYPITTTGLAKCP